MQDPCYIMWTLQCDTLSSGAAWALGHKGLVVPACGILVPQPGMEPSSPALQGGFLTTRPPGQSLLFLLIME